MSGNYWQDKVGLITGASGGLGFELSKALARRGAQVCMAARNEEPLVAAAEQVRSLGARVLTVPCDITQPADVERLFARTAEHFGRLDLLANNAGRSMRKAVLDTTPDDFRELLELNLLALVRCTRAAVPLLLPHRGHVVQIGSLASKVGARYMGAYPASKFAVAAYAQQLRLELGPQGLHVLLVCPGPIERPEVRTYGAAEQNLPPEAQRAGGGARVKRIAPDRLAERILQACERRQPELVMPAKARLLFVLSQLSPRLGDWLLRKSTS